MERKKKFSDITASARLIQKYDKGLLRWVFVRSLINGIGIYFNSVSLGIIIDCIMDGSKKNVMVAVLAVAAVNAVLALVRVLLGKKIDYKMFLVQQKYRKSKTEACFFIDYEKTETVEFQDLRQNIRYSDDNMGTFSGLIWLFERFYNTVATLLLGVGVLATMLVTIKPDSPKTILVMLAAITLIIGIAAGSAKVVKKLQSVSTKKVPKLFDEMGKGNRLGMYLLEHIVHNYNMGKDIRIYRTEGLVNKEFENMTESMGSTYKKVCLSTSMPSTAASISSGLLTGVVYSFMAVAAVLGYITIGNVVVYADSIKNVLGTWSDLFICIGEFTVMQGRLQYTKELFAMADSGDRGEGTEENKHDSKEAWAPETIAFDHVSFHYPASENWVLENVSFEIKKGEKLSIVGKNGAGKTTAIKLLCGLYTPQEGCILIDGVDLKDIPKEVYRKMLATVFQDFKLFSFSIADNLSMGEAYDAEAAKEIFAQVGLEQKIKRLVEGTDTVLYHDYEDGIECSGGEAQKIALARCRYRNTPMMVLDEPTSALDAKTEMEIFSDMNRISEGKTVVFVSHRLSSCRFSDRVLVFDGGKVVQNGTHEELVKENGSVYSELWNAQAQYYV